jgi:hypothetical protein
MYQVKSTFRKHPICFEFRSKTMKGKRQNRSKKVQSSCNFSFERSFADAKELHGLRYARYWGIAKVRGQCLLTAVAQNVKKMALLPSKRKRLWGMVFTEKAV